MQLCTSFIRHIINRITVTLLKKDLQNIAIMLPASSFVWTYFKRCVEDSKVKFSLCGNELSWTGGTSNMRNHIRLKHPSDDQTSLNSPTNLSNKQQSMTSFMDTSKKLSAPQINQITQAIADMIFTDYMLSILHIKYFLNCKLKK